MTTNPSMFCRRCGYALHGLSESRCPECGRAFDPQRRRTFSRRPRRRWVARALGRAALAAVVAALLVAVWLAVMWRNWTQQQRIIAPLQRSGAVVHISRLAPPWLVRSLAARSDCIFDRVDELNLEGLLVTDADLRPLAKLTHLRRLNLSRTYVTGDAVDALRSALPNTHVTTLALDARQRLDQPVNFHVHGQNLTDALARCARLIRQPMYVDWRSLATANTRRDVPITLDSTDKSGRAVIGQLLGAAGARDYGVAVDPDGVVLVAGKGALAAMRESDLAFRARLDEPMTAAQRRTAQSLLEPMHAAFPPGALLGAALTSQIERIVPLRVDWPALAAAGVRRDSPVDFRTGHTLSTYCVLRLMLHSLADDAVELRIEPDGDLLITTAAAATTAG